MFLGALGYIYEATDFLLTWPASHCCVFSGKNMYKYTLNELVLYVDFILSTAGA